MRLLWGAYGRQKQRLSAAMEMAMCSIEGRRMDGAKVWESGIRDMDRSSTRKSLDTSPSSAAVWVGEVDEEDSDDSEYETEQSNGLETTAIFEKMARADTKMLTPEQNITLFALRLALIEKSASGIGTLSFIWATTIIMGGFAANINPVDFVVISIVLVTEGTRIFSRSKELEWEHLASKSVDSSLSSRTAQAALKVGKICRGDTVGKTLSSEQPVVLHPEPASRAVYGDASGWRDDDDCGVDFSHQDFQMSPFSQSMEVTLTAQPKETSWTSDGPTHEDHMSRQASMNNMVTLFRCGGNSFLSTRGVASVLYSVQTISAIICLGLSCWRLFIQEYNPKMIPRNEAPTNLYMSLNIFYTLALTQALLFLLKHVYWEYKINFDQLMVQVNGKSSELGEESQETRKHFFFEVYKKSIDGSLLDGLAMDIVAYSLILLQSDSSAEQLGGLKMLRQIVDRYDGFSLNALRRVGTAPGTLERLVEMLSWRTTHQEAIRREAAILINKVIRYCQNCFRIAAVPGSMEGIVSLLRPQENDNSIDGLKSDSSATLRLNGLRILLACARDPVNLLKVGDTLEIVPILVSFIVVRDVHGFKKMEGTELETFDKALRLLKMLATVRNTSGSILRRTIVRLVSGIASLRDILEFGDCHPQLQAMALEILTNLTLEDGIQRSIGSTGGIIRNLLTLYTRRQDNWSGPVFASEDMREAKEAVSTMAGDALNLLALMNKENCMLMMDLQDGSGMKIFIPALIGLLNDYREQTISAAKILRSLLEYGNSSQKQEIAVCIVRVMRLVMGSSSQKMHEAAVGLPSQVLNVLDEPTYNKAFENMDRTELVGKLLGNLEYNAQASSQFPRVRRHSIEFILALVNRDPTFLDEFMKDGLLERKLLQTLDSICEAEDFAIFSGSEGLTKHTTTMESLVHQSLLELRLLVQKRDKIDAFRKFRTHQTTTIYLDAFPGLAYSDCPEV